MKRWQKLLPAVLLGCSLLVSSAFPPLAHSQESASNRKVIYMFSSEFPPNTMTQYPTPPLQETQFWKLLDRDFSATQDLALTDTLEDADYQIELRCGGIMNCAKVVVDVKDSKRTLLTTFSLDNYSVFWWGIGQPKLPLVSQMLTQKLDERLKQLAQGGYGYTK